MADRDQRLTGRRRARSFAGGLAALLLIGAYAALHRAPDAADAGERSMVVARQPFSRNVTMVGTIQSGDGAPVPAPFDGVLRRIAFSYGDRVRQGDGLAELDTAEIVDQRDAAEAEYLKARQAMTELAGWASGPDMARARRARASAAMETRTIDRDIAETKALLDKGLVPRSEYDALVQRRRDQQLAAATVDDEYRATMERGQGANLRIATLDLARARARLEALDGQLRGAIVRAPADGVLVRPPVEGQQADEGLHVGSRLTRGQLLATVARAGALAVAFKLDEIDVNRIRVGQRVTVSGPAFDGAVLPGRVSSVGGEAVKGTAQPATKASFAAVATLDPLPLVLAAAIRLGMTATITIETYAAPSAIVVPGAAVTGTAPDATVAVRVGGRIVQRPVAIGEIGADGVEIRAGLRDGDMVVWQEPQAQAAQGE